MKPNLTPAQRDLIDQTLLAIEARPEGLDMDAWANKCGSVCCFAGHLAVLHTGRPIVMEDEFTPTVGGAFVGDIAADAIGATKRVANRLFQPLDWPDRFIEQYDAAKSDAQRAAALRARVECWMETGE